MPTVEICQYVYLVQLSRNTEAGVNSHNVSDGEAGVDNVELVALEAEIRPHARDISRGQVRPV